MKKIDNPKEYTVKLLQDVFMGKNGEVSSIKPIHRGYTNFSYIVQFENGKTYQVRLPHCGDLINRANEYQVLSLMDDDSFVYFDVKTGIAVKKWIDGKNPRIPFRRKWKLGDQLFGLIKKLHDKPLPADSKFKKINFDVYNQNLYRLKLAYQAKFLSLIDQYKTDEVVLSHTDINRQNMIQDKQDKLYLIDYEWCGLASDYWDFANFIRESRILWYKDVDWKKYIANFDMQKLKNYIFVCSVYAYLWTWVMPDSKKIRWYRKRTLRQIHYYARGVIDSDK